MFNKILVPLDSSTMAERALGPAMALARPVHGEVILLRVATVPMLTVAESTANYSWTWFEEALEHSRQEAASYLEATRQRDEHPHINLRALVLEGHPAEAIIQCAADEAVDLIVMSSHGYSAVQRLLLGSVAEAVLHQAPCPVLVVRSTEPMNHIMITLDGSTLSEQAIMPGLDLALRLGADVTLLHVSQSFNEEPVQFEWLESGPGENTIKDIYGGPQSYLNDLLQHCPPVGREIRTAVLYGRPASAILDYAAEQKINLIVMSTHGRTGLGRLFYGSVADKVLHNFDGSMLIVRPVAEKLVV